VFSPPKNPCDIYSKTNIDNRKAISYTYLREGDVMWQKRIWREIDLREKQNLQLYYPIEYNPCRTSLFQAITKNVLNGNIVAFADEEFMVPYELSAIRKKLVKDDSIKQFIYDPEGNESEDWVQTIDSTSIYRRILKFRLKEDWFFDKQKSVLEVRILGLGIYTYDEEKEAPKEQFWVYFPACRPFFAKHEVYNSKNDAERRTFEDIFWKRQFASVATKETNVFDRQIMEYSKGIDALLESDRIKNDIFRWEHDLWHF
jgi:gliding motility associated protien GldN